MAVAGDVAFEQGLNTIPFTAGEDVLKGDVLTMADMKVADVGAGETGPFCVALEDVLNGEDGVAAIAPSTVYLEAGTAGMTYGTHVMPSEDVGEEGDVVDVSSPTFDEVVGVCLEAKTVGLFGKVRLGYF